MLSLEKLFCNTKNGVRVHSFVCLDTSKGIPFGRRDNKLDLYHPPNVGRSKDVAAPLVVFIYGGAWGSGDRSIYCLLARQMAEELGAAVICPDYCTYPKVRALKQHTVVLLALLLKIYSTYVECDEPKS